MDHYLFNAFADDGSDGSAMRGLVAESLRLRMWGIADGEPHSRSLAPGDLTLIYLGAPDRLLIGSAVLASGVHTWSASEAQAYPGNAQRGVLLASVERWDPPVPMETVLQRVDRSAGARADFVEGVVRITRNEYETALHAAAGR